jgi:acylphosphatase
MKTESSFLYDHPDFHRIHLQSIVKNPVYNMLKCSQIKIYGQVHGGGFRSAAMGAAYRLRIRGFVRYDEDNSLTIDAQGNPDDIGRFVQFCREWFTDEVIQDFIVSDKEPENYPGFTIRRNISDEETDIKSQSWFQKIKNIIRIHIL